MLFCLFFLRKPTPKPFVYPPPKKPAPVASVAVSSQSMTGFPLAK